MSDGEEWRGEQSEEPVGFSYFGRPLTAEQQAELRRTWLEKLMKGEVNYLTMPRLNLNQPCPKCMALDAKVLFCEGPTEHNNEHHYHFCAEFVGRHEHFHRTCRRCKYMWRERVLNEEPHE